MLEIISKYAWLSSESDLSVASCVTVLTSDLAGLGSLTHNTLQAFGADTTGPVAYDPHEHNGRSTMSLLAEPHAVTTVENNGFQGTRTEVLRAASRGGLAASICWTVNRVVSFGCAEDGRVLLSGELTRAPTDVGLPSRLAPIFDALRADLDYEIDLGAAGAALVELFTGIEIGRSILAKLDSVYLLEPVLEDLRPETPDSTPLRRHRQEAVDKIAAAPPQTCRALAEWAASQAIRQADALDVDPIREVIEQFGQGRTPVAPPELTTLAAVIGADLARARRENFVDQFSRPDPRTYWCQLRHWMVNSVRHACADDSLSAALGAVYAARLCLSTDDPAAGELLLDEAVRLLSIDPIRWKEQAHELPAPPSREQRDAVLAETDRKRAAQREQQAAKRRALERRRRPHST